MAVRPEVPVPTLDELRAMRLVPDALMDRLRAASLGGVLGGITEEQAGAIVRDWHDASWKYSQGCKLYVESLMEGN